MRSYACVCASIAAARTPFIHCSGRPRVHGVAHLHVLRQTLGGQKMELASAYWALFHLRAACVCARFQFAWMNINLFPPQRTWVWFYLQLRAGSRPCIGIYICKRVFAKKFAPSFSGRCGNWSFVPSSANVSDDRRSAWVCACGEENGYAVRALEIWAGRFWRFNVVWVVFYGDSLLFLCRDEAYRLGTSISIFLKRMLFSQGVRLRLSMRKL